MQTYIYNALKILEREYSKLNKLSNLLIRYGILSFLLIFFIGLSLLALSKMQVINILACNNELLRVTATALIGKSFILLAEAIIGGISLEYVIGGNQ